MIVSAECTSQLKKTKPEQKETKMFHTPLLTQIRPTYFSVDCGMAYLIRLEEGKFILIDSTYGE